MRPSTPATPAARWSTSTARWSGSTPRSRPLGGSLTGQSGSIGVGFAIPINQARRTVEQILDTGEAQFPIIGASLDGTYDGEGARIASSASTNGTAPIVPGGPAERAGLEPGDVIVAIDGKPVADSSELIVAIRSRSPGDTITLTVRRDGDERSVKVTLGIVEGLIQQCSTSGWGSSSG